VRLAARAHDNALGPFEVDAFKRRYVYGAVSYAAVSKEGEPLAVFLAEADAERRVTPGPCLVGVEEKGDRKVLREIGWHGFEFLAQRMELTVTRQGPERKRGGGAVSLCTRGRSCMLSHEWQDARLAV